MPSRPPLPPDGAAPRTGEHPSAHPNVVAYRRMIAAFNANDLGAVEALVDPNLEYTLPGKSPLACWTRGVGAHLQMLKTARELSGGTLRLEPRAVAADGDYLVVWGRITAEREGKRLKQRSLRDVSLFARQDRGRPHSSRRPLRVRRLLVVTPRRTLSNVL